MKKSTVFIISLFILFFLGSVHIVSADGIVVRYNFENNGQSDMGNNWDGNLSGNASYSANGKIGSYALNLTNDIYDRFNMRNNIMVGLKNLTITFWIKFNNISSGATYRGVVNLDDNSQEQFNFIYTTGGDYIYKWLYYIVGQPGNWFNNADTGVNDSNTWYHIAFVRNGSDLHYYRDGILIDTIATVADEIPITAINFHLNGQMDNADRAVNGYIDDFRVYNYNLTSAEIWNIYNSGNPIITLWSPANNSDLSSQSWALLGANITGSAPDNFTYYVNGTNVNMSRVMNSTYNYTIAGYGVYYWNVEYCLSGTCTNSSGGINNFIRQPPPLAYFSSTWDTTKVGSAGNQIILPIYNGGTYNFTVDWGDNSSSNVTAWNDAGRGHNYTNPGIYNVNITNTIIGFRFNNGGDRLKIINITNWGNLHLGNLNGYFYGCENLNVTATDNLDLTGTTDLSNMFRGATNFNSTIGGWNVSNVTSMSSMFQTATSFNQNISGWNTSNVISMASMFDTATKFNQNIGNWNVGKVTNMNSMFQYASKFNQDIRNWDVSKVSTMSAMFYQAVSFNQNISGWNVGNVTNMNNMFQSAISFNQNLGSWNVSNVTTMTNMFSSITLSTINYDALLVGWSSRIEKNAVPFHGGNSKYSGTGFPGRFILTGIYNWTITDGGKEDLINPTVVVNGSIINNSIITVDYYNIPFNYTDQYSANAMCSLYLNDIKNVSNSSTINNTLTNLNITGLLSGLNYYYKIGCNDTSNNTGYSPIYNFSVSIIDIISPVVTIDNSVVNNSFVGNSFYSILFNFTDARSVLASCSVWLNGTQNVTNATTINNTITSLTIPGLADGVYWWNISCTDNASNVGWNVGRYYFTKYNTSLIIYEPDDNNISRNILNVNFSYTDLNEGIQCSLNVNGTSVASIGKMNTSNYTYLRSPYNGYTVTQYIWGGENREINGTFTGGTNVIDNNWETYGSEASSKTIYYNTNYTYLTNTTLDFRFKTDHISDSVNIYCRNKTGTRNAILIYSNNGTNTTLNISAFVNPACLKSEELTEISLNLTTIFIGAIKAYEQQLRGWNYSDILSGQWAILSYTPPSDNLYIWNISCNSSISEITTSSSYRNFYYDTTGATITNQKAIPNTVKSSTIINVSAMIIDLYNVTSATLNNNITMNKGSGNEWSVSTTATSLGCPSNGICTRIINATDTVGNPSTANINIYIDNTAPIINIDSSIINGTNIINNSYTIRFNVTDNNYSIMPSCYISLNDSLNGTLTSIANNTLTGFQFVGLNNGIYHWNISCIDGLSNQGYSGIYYFTKSAPLFNSIDFSGSNLVHVGETNYTRQLNYIANISCSITDIINLQVFISGIEVQKTLLTCYDISANYSGTYQYTSEGNNTLSFYLNNTIDPIGNSYKGNTTLFWDIYSPTAVGRFSLPYTGNATTVEWQCNDSAYPILYYDYNFNNNNIEKANYSNSTIRNYITALKPGTNTLIGNCSDPFSTTGYSISNIDNTFFNSIDMSESILLRVNGTNYTRRVYYIANISCDISEVVNLQMFIDDVETKKDIISCTGSSNNYSGNYQALSEGNKTISFYMNDTSNPSKNGYLGNDTLYWDIYSPTINITYGIGTGFSVLNMTVNMTCNDSATNILNYIMTINNISIFLSNETNGTKKTYTQPAVSGINIINGLCKDYFSNVSSVLNFPTYSKEIVLIDERTALEFDVQNISGARIYSDDNSSYYDFKATNTTKVNFSTGTSTKLRVELTYLSGDVVIRYIDISLNESDPLRICANKEGITHYENIITSSYERPVALKNVYAQCLVALDYTRFAYQDSKILKTYTTAFVYELYLYSNTIDRTKLTDVDGSIATYIQIDVIEFSETRITPSTAGETLQFEPSGTSGIKIHYKNNANDAVQSQLIITRMDTSTEVYNYAYTTNPNNITYIMDYSILTNVTNQTLFRAEVIRTDDAGIEHSIKRYFDIHSKAGILVGAVGFVIALLLTIFGLTLASTKITFGWFGIIILLGSIGILSFSVQLWYVIFLEVINVVLLMFISVIMWKQNSVGMT